MDIPIPRCKFPRQASISDTDSVVLLRQALKFLKFTTRTMARTTCSGFKCSRKVPQSQKCRRRRAVVGETRGLLLLSRGGVITPPRGGDLLAPGGISRPAVTKAQ